MKRLIAVLLVIALVLTAGCSIPFFGKANKEPSEDVDGLDFIRTTQTESSQNLGDSEAKENLAGDEANVEANSSDGGEANSEGDAEGDGESDGNVPQKAPFEEDILPEQTQDSEWETGVLSSSITTEPDEEFTKSRLPVTIYYQDQDGYLIPMTRWIMLQPGIARASISLDIDSPINREQTTYYGVYPVIPSGTEILGIDIRDGVATIDFSRQFLNYKDARAERNLVASVIYTLTEFKTIDKVRILVNGYLQGEMKYGTDISRPLGREDIYINAGQLQVEDSPEKVDVFLYKKANEGFTYMVPISVPAAGFAGELPEILVKQLLEVDSTGELATQMPEGVELLNWKSSNGLLTLNFSDGFADDSDEDKKIGVLKQLAYTVRQVKGITGIRVLVEGRQTELPYGMENALGLAIPSTINDVMDR